MLTPAQKKRGGFLAIQTCFVIGFGIFIFSALKENITYFVTPTELYQKQSTIIKKKNFYRLGGVVKKGTLVKDPNTMRIHFIVTDFKTTIPVTYQGITPDLFKEGQGVIAEGYWENTVFTATKILAKHDENYAPPQLQELKSQ